MKNTQEYAQDRVIYALFPSHIHETAYVNHAPMSCAVCGSRLKSGAKRYCSIACYRVVQRSVPVEDRFWSKVKKTDGCWLWTASRIGKWQYGQFGLELHDGRRTSQYAHRVAWELSFGPVPDGLSVLHRCDVPTCVRPDHLFLGTQLDNMRDAASKGRLHVPRPRRQKLTTEQLAEITELDRSGMLRCEIARIFGVSKGFISLYLTGKRRQHDAPRQREQVA